MPCEVDGSGTKRGSSSCCGEQGVSVATAPCLCPGVPGDAVPGSPLLLCLMWWELGGAGAAALRELQALVVGKQRAASE